MLLVSPASAQEAKPAPATAKPVIVAGSQEWLDRWLPAMKKFEAADLKQQPLPGGVVFTGSSSILLWDLPKSFPGLDALNRGFGGSMLSDTDHYFNTVILKYQPRTVVLYAGDNDIGRGRTTEEIVGSLKSILAKMQRSLPETKLIYVAIKPSIRRIAQIDQVHEANKQLKQLMDNYPNGVFLDIATPMLDAEGKPRADLLVKDGLHLSEAGYKIWDDLLRPYVTEDARMGRKRGIYDRYHHWAPPATLEEWKVESEKLRNRALVASGIFPKPEKIAIQPTYGPLVDMGDHTVQGVFFESLPGLLVTGSLYKPKKISGKIPGVLSPHGHATNGRKMKYPEKDILASFANGGESFRSSAQSSGQARCVQLVRMGTVVFAYDMIGYADQRPLSHRQGFSDADAALWLHSKFGLQTYNSIRALDFITSLAEVDVSRIGVTGASGGGTQSFILGAIDQRITASFPAVMVSTGMQGGCICENADHLRVGTNNIAYAALMAPRAQSMSAANDWTIDIERLGLPELKHVYGLYGAADKVEAKCYPQFGHNYNQPAREQMYDWFNTHLKLNIEGPIKEHDFYPLTEEQLTLYTEKTPLPATALEEEALRAKLRKSDLERLEKLVAAGDQAAFVKQQQPAVEVILPIDDAQATATFAEPKTVEGITVTSGVLSAQQTHVPVTLFQPAGQKTDRVVLWVDGQGVLTLDPQDQRSAALKALLATGVNVATLNPLLTGAQAEQTNPYLEKLKKLSPSHQAKNAGEDYTGFMYGYNLTILAERLRDIDRVKTYLVEQGYKTIDVVGTGDAGVWAMLARSRWSDQQIGKTVVDLNGFRFSAIQSNLDANMLPGALKYGGVGGIAASQSIFPLEIFSAGPTDDFEIAPLVKFFGAANQLKLEAGQLDRTQLPKLLAL